MTREEWLEQLRGELEPLFETQGYTLPATRVTCGFPSRRALSISKRVIGECWSAEQSEGDVFEILITPLIADPVEVAGVLIHELGHAAVGTECAHRGLFVKCVKAMGLVGKPTATEVGPDLQPVLQEIVDRIGPYPHERLNAKSKIKKQTTRLLKAECPKDGYTVRVTRKWIDLMGPPICPCKTAMIEIEPEEQEEGE